MTFLYTQVMQVLVNIEHFVLVLNVPSSDVLHVLHVITLCFIPTPKVRIFHMTNVFSASLTTLYKVCDHRSLTLYVWAG